jgi:hypothetical protein
LHPHITAIGTDVCSARLSPITADPDISIIGITVGIVNGEIAQSLPRQVAGTSS